MVVVCTRATALIGLHPLVASYDMHFTWAEQWEYSQFPTTTGTILYYTYVLLL